MLTTCSIFIVPRGARHKSGQPEYEARESSANSRSKALLSWFGALRTEGATPVQSVRPPPGGVSPGDGAELNRSPPGGELDLLADPNIS